MDYMLYYFPLWIEASVLSLSISANILYIPWSLDTSHICVSVPTVATLGPLLDYYINYYLHYSNMVVFCLFYYSRAELKKITEMFTRMFHDPHSKVSILLGKHVCAARTWDFPVPWSIQQNMLLGKHMCDSVCETSLITHLSYAIFFFPHPTYESPSHPG